MAESRSQPEDVPYGASSPVSDDVSTHYPQTPTQPSGVESDTHILDSTLAGLTFLRGSGLRLLAYAAGLLVGLAATPFVVRHLGPGRWGDYSKVISLSFIVAAVTDGGLGQMGVRELSLGEGVAHRRFLRELLGLRLLLTLVGLLAAVAFAWLAGWGVVPIAGTAIAGCGFLLMNTQGTLALPLASGLRFRWLALNDFMPQFASALLMLTLVITGASLLPFYCAPLAAGACALAITGYVVRREWSLLPVFRPARWRQLLRQTFAYAIATATGAIYFRISLIATSLISTAQQTGYFALSFRILDLIAVVPWVLIGSAFPILVRAASNDPERLRYSLQRLTEGSLILGGWFALCLVTGAPVGIHVLEGGGHQFEASIPVLRILGAAIATTFPLATFAYTMLSMKMYRELIAINLTIMLLACFLSPILISPWGARGAAILSVSLEALLCSGYAGALFRAQPALRFSVRSFSRPALAVALAFGSAAALDSLPIVAPLVGSAVLVVALMALRAVPAELAEIIRISRDQISQRES